MSRKLIEEINDLPLFAETEKSVRELLRILSNDWIKGLIALKRSRVLINKFGNTKAGVKITEIINVVRDAVPKKYKTRYSKYFSSIIPLNNLLQKISNILTQSEFWVLDKEVCLTSLLTRFEVEYAHLDHNAQKLLEDSLKGKSFFNLERPVVVRTMHGSFISADQIFQHLAASLDRNLRFIQYHLKRIPLVNTAIPPDVYKAGTFQMTGELWNSVFYLIDQVSLFDWYAKKVNDNPETLYYQPKNKNDYIGNIIGELRETQWLLQLNIDSEEWYGLIKHSISPEDPLFPLNDKELRAYVELSEMCHDEKILKVEFKNGLKVKEYVRAWSVISERARCHFNEKKQLLLEIEDQFDLSTFLILSEADLLGLLTEKGKLEHETAKKSIELLTYWNRDKDVFSSPLFPTTGGHYFILTSIFVSGNPVRSVFRLLSYDEIDISFKGISSENEVAKLFTEMGFKCLSSYKFHDSSGPGDIDCIAFKDDTFIVCESKNIIPNESIYDRYRTLELFTKKASNQANRAKRFVGSHLPQLCEHLSAKISNSEAVRIYPVIITNLFGFTGSVINAVPVCDFSAFMKFAEAKYVFRNIKGKEGTNRIPVKELYKGDLPTAAELVNQLHNPFQVEHVTKKLEITSINQPMTEELVLEIFDVRERGIDSDDIDWD